MLQRDPSPGNGPRSPRDPSALSSPCILNRAIPSAAFKTNTSYFASSVKTPSTQARARVGPAPTLPVTRMPDYLQPGQMSAGKRKAVYDRDAFEEEVETNSFNENKYASDDEKPCKKFVKVKHSGQELFHALSESFLWRIYKLLPDDNGTPPSDQTVEKGEALAIELCSYCGPGWSYIREKGIVDREENAFMFEALPRKLQDRFRAHRINV